MSGFLGDLARKYQECGFQMPCSYWYFLARSPRNPLVLPAWHSPKKHQQQRPWLAKSQRQRQPGEYLPGPPALDEQLVERMDYVDWWS